MREYEICIPTYNRLDPLCFNMLQSDSDITLNMFVRQELLDSGFYDSWKSLERVNVISLGYGLEELGETRERIMDWCRAHKVRYCLMLDDGVKRVRGNLEDVGVDACMTRAITRLKRDALGDKCLGMTLCKIFGYLPDGKSVACPYLPRRQYFNTIPTQAVLLDVKRVSMAGLHYRSLKRVGFEDCAFFVDALKKGCVYAADDSIWFNAIVPNAKKPGGSHANLDYDLEAKYDAQMKRCWEYIGPMYGVRMEKRYRSYAQCMLTMIEFNLDYFYEVLIASPEKNRKIIEKRFAI